MDEAVQIAIQGIHDNMAHIRRDLSGIRADFRQHVVEDQKVWNQVEQWTGGLKFFKWLLGIGLPAIFAALLALVMKH